MSKHVFVFFSVIGLIILLAVSGCTSNDSCPTPHGYVSCGRCAEGQMKGVCISCPPGTSCSSNGCGCVNPSPTQTYVPPTVMIPTTQPTSAATPEASQITPQTLETTINYPSSTSSPSGSITSGSTYPGYITGNYQLKVIYSGSWKGHYYDGLKSVEIQGTGDSTYTINKWQNCLSITNIGRKMILVLGIRKLVQCRYYEMAR